MRIILKLLAAPLFWPLTLLVAVLNFCFFLCVMGVLRPVLSLSDRSPVCFYSRGIAGAYRAL